MSETTYNWDSNEYARNSSAQHGWGLELITKLKLSGTESILDIGCGTGETTAAIAARLPDGHVIGVDNSPDMISFAKRNYLRHKLRNVDFILMDATNLSFKRRFDAAFSNAALHWVRNQVAVLNGVQHCLNTRGRLLFQMAGKGNASELISVLEDTLAKRSWRTYFESYPFPYFFWGPEEYSMWLKEVGLKEKRLELIEKDMIQEGREGLAGWIKTTWLPYTEKLPASFRDVFISEIVDSYVENFPPDEQGRVHVKMVRLEVEAIKQ
jgi:trans-aconitate methyltransferase